MPRKNAIGWRRPATPPCLVTVDNSKLRHILGEKAKLVRRKKDWKKVPELVAAMLRILRKAGGQGISAPQVGFSLAVVVIETRKTKTRRKVKPSEKPLVMINPKIKRRSRKTVSMKEGCLSFHTSAATCVVRAFVDRPRSVTVTFLDPKGEEQRQRFTGFLARVVQHEIGHLSGEMFLQRVDWRGNVWDKLKLEPM